MSYKANIKPDTRQAAAITSMNIDFDGCLDSACQSAKYKAFLENFSQEVQKSLQENAKNPPTVEILIGSQRQSQAEELRMITGHSRPCAGYYKRFKEDLQITLRDLFYNFSHGTSFTQLEQLQKDYIGNSSTIEGTEHFIDHSKLLLIYAQIHYIANKYKTEEIRYGFYDDKEKEILSNLDIFFKKNPCWIPSNIELFLHRYAKNDLKPEPISKIKGVGEINNNYSRTIKDLLVYNGICSRLIYSNKYKKEYHISPKKVLPALSALKDSSHSTALKLLQNTHRGILNKRVLFEVENTSRPVENQINYILSNLYQVYSPHFELTPKHVKILTLNKFAISRDLFIKFTEYAKNIETSDVNMRISLQNSLRGRDSEYFMGQGSVYSKQIISNRRAIRQLFNNHHGASILITPERGGGLVLDLLKNLRFQSPLAKKDSGSISSRKIPKLSEETRDEYDLAAAGYEIQQYPFSKTSKRGDANTTKPVEPEYSRKEHIQRLKEAIILAIKNGHKTIGLVDTMVSGMSARILIKIARKIGSLYRNVKFNILIHQHTLEINDPYAHPNAYGLYSNKKTIKLSTENDFHIEKIIPEKAIANEKENSKTICFGKITFANGNEENEHNYNSIIGEDVDFQLSYEGPNTSRPFCIFDNHLNVVVLKPSGGATAREAVQMLVTGELDHGLKECGILLEDNSNLQLKGKSSKNFKKLSLENNTLNTQMWKKSAEIASSEKKLSKKEKSSLKRSYDKQGREQENSMLISNKKTYYGI
ncbi:hypothetical protein FQR65_LT05079 [Abscondita terminalis]|nr:hypothetical protein FQR65_LT05079 [Abscondita terminalis]